LLHIYLVLSLLPRKGIQIILFSATFPDHVRTFASKFAPNPNKIELQKEELSVDNIRQFYMDCKNEEHKYDILVSLYQLLTIGQSIIFCQVIHLIPPFIACDFNSYQHRHTADRISQRMTAEGHKVASLHGAKDAAERDAIIDRFREGREKASYSFAHLPFIE
jgi:ATP-dependent RNA helicase DDX19/DBP5